jgi:hypothetical protein
VKRLAGGHEASGCTDRYVDGEADGADQDDGKAALVLPPCAASPNNQPNDRQQDLHDGGKPQAVEGRTAWPWLPPPPWGRGE